MENNAAYNIACNTSAAHVQREAKKIEDVYMLTSDHTHTSLLSLSLHEKKKKSLIVDYLHAGYNSEQIF